MDRVDPENQRKIALAVVLLVVIALLGLYAKSRFDNYERQLTTARREANTNFANWQATSIKLDDTIGQLDELGINLPGETAPVQVPSQAPFPKELTPGVTVITEPGRTVTSIVVEPSPSQPSPSRTSPPPASQPPPTRPSPQPQPPPTTTCVVVVLGIQVICK